MTVQLLLRFASTFSIGAKFPTNATAIIDITNST